MVEESIINIAGEFVRHLPEEINVKRAFLFGSYAKGNSRNDSDIDIAVVIANMDDFYSTQLDLMKLRREIDLRIEAHPFDEEDFNNSNPFASDIILSGIELKLEKSV